MYRCHKFVIGVMFLFLAIMLSYKTINFYNEFFVVKNFIGYVILTSITYFLGFNFLFNNKEKKSIK